MGDRLKALGVLQSMTRGGFGEILRGLELGAAYAFDKESYTRFYPLALEAGIPVEAVDFDKLRESGGRFFTVRLVMP